MIAIGLRDKADGCWDQYHSIDLSNLTVPSDLFTDIDTLFHLAGKAHALSEIPGTTDSEYDKINYHATLSLLDQCKTNNVRSFVLFSTVKVFGEFTDKDCFDQSSPANPVTPYAASKFHSEEALITGGYVAHPVCLRLSMVYGPDSKGNLDRMIAAIKTGWFPPLQNIKNRRSMVHVDDVISIAYLSSLSDIAKGKRYIVSDGVYYSTGQIYSRICKALKRKILPFSIPIFILRILAFWGDIYGFLFRRRFPLNSDSLRKLTTSECHDSTTTMRELEYNIKNNLLDFIDRTV